MDLITLGITRHRFGDGMAECAASWTEDLMVGSSIPTVAQGNLIFPAQMDERHQGEHSYPRDSALICLAALELLVK